MLCDQMLLFFCVLILLHRAAAQTTVTVLDTNDPFINNVPVPKISENDRDLNTSPITISVLDSTGVVGELASGPVISGLTGISNLAGVTDSIMRQNRGALPESYTNPLQMVAGGHTNVPAATVPLGDGVTSPADNLARPVRNIISGDFINAEFTTGSPRATKHITYMLPKSAFIGEDGLLATNAAVGLAGQSGIHCDLSDKIGSGPITPEVLSQAGVYGMTVNPIDAEAVRYRLPNPLKTINELEIPTHAGSALINPVVISRSEVMNPLPGPSIIPSKLATSYNLMDSKNILTRVTGISAANLGAKGKFIVKSTSPLAPTGLSISANNLIMDGPLAVTGHLPFLGSVRVDGTMPDRGIGNVLYACGNGNIDVLDQGPTSMGPVSKRFGMGGLDASCTGGWSSILGNRPSL